MARGWESKAIDEQQAARDDTPTKPVRPVTDGDKQRQLQSLLLQRERVLAERTSSPHRRTALQAALTTLEEKLAELGWSVQI